MTAASPQQKPTLWEETLLLGAGPTGERSGPPPRLAVEGRSSGHGPMLRISDVDKVKPMLLPHGGWPMAAGPASRLGSIEPGDKTGLRLSPHLAPSTSPSASTRNQYSCTAPQVGAEWGGMDVSWLAWTAPSSWPPRG